MLLRRILNTNPPWYIAGTFMFVYLYNGKSVSNPRLFKGRHGGQTRDYIQGFQDHCVSLQNRIQVIELRMVLLVDAPPPTCADMLKV